MVNWNLGGERNRKSKGGMQECTDMAEHHQMRERLDFYHRHPLPPFLPRYPVLLGEIWEEERGREGKECWGGLSIPLTPLLFSPGPLQKVDFRPALANSWPLLLFTSFPSSLSLMSPCNCSSSLSLASLSLLFISVLPNFEPLSSLKNILMQQRRLFWQ